MSHCISRLCRHPRSWNIIDKLGSLAGYGQQCCGIAKASKARLNLLNLESRVVPALPFGLEQPFGLLDSFLVDANDDGGTLSSIVLQDETIYTIIITGDAELDAGRTRVDAEYYNFDTDAPDDFLPQEEPVDDVNVGIRIEGIEAGKSLAETWFENYCANHTYKIDVEGTGDEIKVFFQDGTGAYYDNSGQFTINIYSKLQPMAMTPIDPSCYCVAGVGVESAFAQSSGPAESIGGVRYADGVIRIADVDLLSNAFGLPWGQSRTWTNDPALALCCSGSNGAGVNGMPQLQLLNNGSAIALVSNCASIRYFDVDGSTITARDYHNEVLSKDSKTGVYTLLDTTGAKFIFNPLDSGGECDRGKLTLYTSPYGHEVTVTRADGRITAVTRAEGGNDEAFVYEYYEEADGKMSVGLLKSVTWQQDDVTIRSVDYDYHDGSDTFGSAGTLRLVTIKDANDDPIESTYYRYHMSGSATGFNNAIKFVVRKASYDRMLTDITAASGNPDAVDETDMAMYADYYLEYDEFHRVTRQKIQGAGCSSCFGGIGDYTYSYEVSELDVPVGYNHWAMKTTETLADGNQNIVYSNFAGQVMMFVYKDTTTGQQAMTHFVYDGQGRLVQRANPSAVTNWNDDFPELVIVSGVRLGVETEYQVNTYTTGSQATPNIARNWAGDSVIVWASSGQDGNGNGVFGQRFNAVGQPVGAEFQVNTYTTSHQRLAVPAMDQDGDFVVVWSSNGEDGSAYGVFAQRYNSAGTPQGGNFQVNTSTSANQYYPSVAMDGEGNFTIVWMTQVGDGSGYGVVGRRYDASGSAVSGEFQVNTYTTGNQWYPRIGMNQEGDFAVVWASAQDGSFQGIYGQLYDSAGTPQGSEFQINDFTTNDQMTPAIAMDADGDFIVAWHTYNGTFTDAEVWARRFSNTGTALDADEFQVNSHTTNFQQLESIACNAVGDFVIAWSSQNEDGNNYGVYGRFYMADGSAGSPFRINNFTSGFQGGQTIASDYDGNFLVTWGSDGLDGSDYGIYARPLEPTYSYVADAAGLVERYVYGRVTTADQKSGSDPTEIGDDGDVAGALKSVWLQLGDLGTVNLGSLNQLSSMTYYEYEDGAGGLVHPIATTTVYRNTDSTGAQTTSYEYSWTGSNIAPESVAITLAKVTAAQNGSNSANETTTTYFDILGRPEWTKDADGSLHYTAHAPFGGVVTIIRDVEDANTGDFDNLPSGWTTPGGGGLHLMSEFEVDGLGRTTYSIDPNGSKTYTFYLDADKEVRVYPGWTDSATTGPVQVWREDRGLKYTDVMTLSGSVNVTSKVPDGDDVLSGLTLETLTRTWVNKAGQVVQSDAYHALSSSSYDPSAVFGSVNTNYYSTTFDYDKRGRFAKTVSPTGTINRTQYDGLGRVISTWVGTDDEPDLGFWSFTNTAGTDMTEVAANVYDNGSLADGNLTYSLQYPGDAAARAMQMVSDWRNRPVLSRAGSLSAGTSTPTVEFTASTFDVTESFVTSPDDDTYVVITARLSAISSLPTTVELTAGHKDDTAAAGSDYTNPGTVTILIPAGQATATTTIKILGDASKESAETFKLFLANPTNSSLGSTTTTTVTIRDEDNPASAAMRFATGAVTVTERRGGSATVTLTQPVSGASFAYRITAGSASLGTDIGSATGTFTFGDDETIAIFALPILNDAAVEGSETCTLEIFDLDGVTMSATTIPVTIIDDDFTTSGEDTITNRPLSYVEYDNLNRVVVSAQYDGDALTLTTPSAPSSGLMRSYRTTSFDDQGRVYRTDTYGVDYSGTKSTYSLYSQTWYNKRGLVMKSAQPGGQVVKNVFDGAGRVITSYVTDGGSDSGYGDAEDVTGDIVYTQSHNRYANQADNANGTLLVETSRKERFHDASGTGALDDYNSNPTARISYMGMYYDVGNRLIASVNVGTNTISTVPTVWSRPGSAPSRSATVLVTSYAYNSAGWVETTTDPRDLDSVTQYDDLGRTVKRIENYVNGTVSDQDDKTTEFAYDGSGHMTSYKAWLNSTDYQETGYVYGVSSSTGSYVASNDILRIEKYPDKSSGDPSSSAADQISYKVNALGQRFAMTDRNGNVHEYRFDVVGRPTADIVTTLGGGVDGTVRRLDTAYDSAGRAYLFTSRGGTSDTATIVNQVQRGFNGLGQITSEAQGHTSAGAGSAPTVTYAYTEMSGGANHSRLTTLTYPTDLTPDSTLTFNYTGGDDTISRLTSISNDTVTLESYSYLGLGTVVIRAHAQSGVDLTYVDSKSTGDGGDQYIGLDRFGRVIDQRWTSSGTDKDRFLYTYDENGNRITRDISMGGAGSSDNYDHKYSYDGLNQLTQYDRGVLSAGSIGSPIVGQSWNPDALGNFESVTNTTYGSSTVTENRAHNRQNQLNSVTITGASTTTLTYDNAGSTTKSVFDDGKSTTTTFTFDAWNRMIEFKGSARYAYDALGRRIKEDTRAMFYSKDWQVLEERSGGAVLYRYAWSPVYVDAMITRDEFSGGSFIDRVYALTDANFNVTALVAYISSSWQIAERYVYDPYGTFTKLSSTWGTYSGSDRKWVYLHQGGRWDGDVGKYHFRRRDYDSALMRWAEVDPIGFQAGDSDLYRAYKNSPIVFRDSLGLAAVPPRETVPNCDSKTPNLTHDGKPLELKRVKDDCGNSMIISCVWPAGDAFPHYEARLVDKTGKAHEFFVNGQSVAGPKCVYLYGANTYVATTDDKGCFSSITWFNVNCKSPNDRSTFLCESTMQINLHPSDGTAQINEILKCIRNSETVDRSDGTNAFRCYQWPKPKTTPKK